SLTCSPIHDPRGDLVLVSVVARDVSASKKAETERREATEALRRTNEDLQHLSYAASHDLQEPLRMIANYAHLLKQNAGNGLDERGRTFLEHIQSGAVRMDRLLRALQEYWGLDRAKQPLHRVDANLVLESALKN